ncbi:uncharacterized protein LOC127181551 [Labeo rohita]|uniref:uncharacterized protein LOC127181551 n=1 Tax=Labeo rohita TaxID=84645 RepID=UPI0021E22266|nr:uncharacterized protein LOC127181551 [Labeo rohita]
MDSMYENSSFILSTVASDVKCSQYKGNSTEMQENEREVYLPKWTKVLLIVFAVCLLFALGGLCIMGILYVHVSMQLSAQKTNNTIMTRQLEELTTNYTRVREQLNINNIMVRKSEELKANYTKVREQLSFYEAFKAQSLNCDMTSTTFKGKLYFFSCDKLNWLCSRAFCVSKGADLVTITSQTEQRFLLSKIKDWNWIGLNDLETEGHWVWVNNQTLNETGVQFWHKRTSEKSEPDNWKEDDHTGENCAIVKNDVNYLDRWFDVSCNYQMKFICEKKYQFASVTDANHSDGNDYRCISRMLNVPVSTVGAIIRKWKEHQFTINRPRSGAPRKKPVRGVQRIIRRVLQEPRTTQAELQEDLASAETITYSNVQFIDILEVLTEDPRTGDPTRDPYGFGLGVVPKKAKDAIAEKCTKVCAKDLRAFSMFETPTFIELAQTILDTGSTHGRCNVKDLLPSGVTLSRFTQKKYESLTAELLPTIKKAIAEGLACGASTDMWTDDHRKVSYNCITLHYIDDNWEFNNKIDRLVFVSDQAANVQAALSQWVHKSCLAHILNTVLKHTFKKSNEGDEEEDGNEEELQQVRACIEQCKTLTTFFKHSGLQLRLKQSLKQECETRWNTKLEMVKYVLNAFVDIQSILFERGEMHRMSHISKDILQMLIHFLQPFKEATEELSGSKYCTINLVALWKSTLLTHCQLSQDDPLPLRIMKHRCMGLISERIVLGHHEKLGVLLWPKFKQLWMFTPEEKKEIYESACRELASLPKRAATTEVNAQQNQVEDTEMARSVPPPGPVPLFSQWPDIENAELDTGLDELHRNGPNGPKWTKVILIVLGFSLVFALGGLCALLMVYKNTLANFESLNKKHVMVSMQLSAQEKNGTAMKKEFNDLTARYNSLKERLSFFKAQSCNLSVDGWIACRGKLYLFSSDKLNWSRSREVCVSKGADLVTITSQTEQDVLVSKIKQTHWIGLNDLETEGRWVWVNNQTLTETKVQFWFSEKQREPDNWSKQDPSGENCASLGDDNGNFQSWFDASCKKKKKFICEKKYRFTPISDSN